MRVDGGAFVYVQMPKDGGDLCSYLSSNFRGHFARGNERI